MKSAYAAKDEVLAEKSKVQEQLAVAQVEKAALEDQLHRVERRLQDENSALQASVMQGAERAKELQAQLESVQAAKGQLEANLAVSSSEKRGTDEAATNGAAPRADAARFPCSPGAMRRCGGSEQRAPPRTRSDG